VIPNPWDVGSARYLQHIGFPALATTSAGFAFSRGLPDSEFALSRDRNLTHIADIAAAVDVQVNADFASGYGRAPEDVADSVIRCVATGVAGLSIEDATGDPSSPLYDLPIAVERVHAARQAIDQSGADVMLTARAECSLVGHPDALRESVRLLQAYAEAGGDVLFAPGLHEPAEIKALVEAVRPKPFNLLVVRDSGLSVADIAALGSGGVGPISVVQASRRGSPQGSLVDHSRVRARRIDRGAYASCASARLRTGWLDRDAVQRWDTHHVDARCRMASSVMHHASQRSWRGSIVSVRPTPRC
jgi:2-methylisocitrate lyase-like PEP mutase family enzyme